jgi:hypothetical protein
MGVMAFALDSLSQREREGAHRVSDGKGEGDRICLITLTLPQLRCSLPLPLGEGM